MCGKLRLLANGEPLWSRLMGGTADRYFLPALIGVAPVILALITWRPNDHGTLHFFAFFDALPVLIAELVLTIVALREGLVRWLRYNRPSKLAGTAIAAWIAIAVTTILLVSPAPFSAARWTLHWLVHLAFGFSVAFLCSRLLRVRDFTVCMLVGFLFYVAVMVAFVIRHWGQPIDWVHDLPSVTHIRHIGYYAAAITSMSVGAMADAKGRRSQALSLVMVAIAFAFGLWTGSRGMAVAVAGATIIGVLILPSMRNLKVCGAAALAIGIATAVVAWLPVPDGTMMGLARTVTATSQHELTTGRTTIWVNVIHAIARHPVFGFGAGQMALVAPYFTIGQPHNLILQILLDWGLAGFACVIIMAFYYFRRIWPRIRRDSGHLAAPFMGAASILLLSMIDGSMFHILSVAIFATCAGMLAAQPTTNGELRQATS